MRLALSLLSGLILTTFAGTASAYGSGATGYSGKDGTTCNGCHSGGKAPQVLIEGPDSIAAGQTADFTFTVTTTQTRAGADIASENGIALTPGTNLQELGGELAHTKSTPVSGGKAVFKFKVTAPASGSFTLYAAGLAANGSGTGGDKAAATTKAITVTGAATTPPPAGTTPPPAGTTPPASTDPAADDDEPTTAKDATEPASTKKTTKKKASDDESDDDDDDDDSRSHRIKSSAPETATCAMRPGNVDPAGLSAATGVLFGLALATRRRRR